MKKYLLPILFIGAYASAQYKPMSNLVQSNHNYLFTNQVEIDNTQGGETPTWDYEYVFDGDKKRISEIRNKRINEEGTASTALGIVEFSYPDANTILTKERTRDAQGTWKYVTQVKYTYNDDGTIAEILQQEFNEDENGFENKGLYTFQHNEQGKISSILWQDYIDEQNETGDFVKVLSDLHRDEYTYNNSGKLIQHLRVSTEDSTPIERRTYQYDEQGMPKGYIWEDYNESGNYVKVFEQTVEVENGNAVSITDYEYDNAGVRKRATFLFVSSFDENIPADEVFSFRDKDNYVRFYEHNWYQNKNAKTDERNFSFDHHPTVNDWRQEKSFTNKYQKLETLSVYDLASNKDIIKVFPNPTTNYFRIQTKADKVKVDVYDVSGKLVKSFPKKQEQYDVSSLNRGVYMVSIITDNSKQTIKLIKN